MKALMFILLMASEVPALTVREALGMIESGNDDHAVGSNGEVSRFQILPRLWSMHTPDTRYHDADHAWIVAENILVERQMEFVSKHHRRPTPFELYVLWNAPSQLLRYNLVSSAICHASRPIAFLIA